MTKKRDLAAYAVNLFARTLIGMALMLPYESRVRFFGGMMARIVAPLFGYTRRAKAHLAQVWPDLSISERRRIARSCCDNFGRTLIENYSGFEIQKRADRARIVGNGLSALDSARKKGQPVIFVSGHFGNYEVPRRALTKRGFTIGGLYRPMTNQYFNTHYEQTMKGVSGPVFAQDTQGLLGFVRMLRSGGMATILFDVRASKFPDLSFVGLQAPTSTAAAELSLRFNALLVPYFGRRLENGLDFEVIIADPIEMSDPLTMMQAATDLLSELAKTYPEQYFWVHRRWRRPPPISSFPSKHS